MKSVRQLSAKELAKVLEETQYELVRRENIKHAHDEVMSILKKYNISIDDVISGFKRTNSPTKDADTKVSSSKKPPNKNRTAKRKKEDSRSKVMPKYRDPQSGKNWSGRGRSPAWVKDILQKNSITLEQFKSSPDYAI